MAQVVDAAKYGAEPTPELRISWLSQKYDSLPRSGGVLEQSYSLMHRMTIHSNIYDAVVRVRGMVGDEIHRLTESERRLIKYLRDEGLL